jgi:hypothetical protein
MPPQRGTLKRAPLSFRAVGAGQMVEEVFGPEFALDPRVLMRQGTGECGDSLHEIEHAKAARSK